MSSGPIPGRAKCINDPINHGQPVYYCSQDIVGPASCYRSDTQGAVGTHLFSAYTGQGAGSCGGLHGHVHVAARWHCVAACESMQRVCKAACSALMVVHVDHLPRAKRVFHSAGVRSFELRSMRTIKFTIPMSGMNRWRRAIRRKVTPECGGQPVRNNDQLDQ
jgi:hypothetical protein